MMRVTLPSGSASGGLLIARSERPVFVLFSDDTPETGDRLTVPPARRFRITSVQKARLREQRVTVLEVRPEDFFEGDEPDLRPAPET